MKVSAFFTRAWLGYILQYMLKQKINVIKKPIYAAITLPGSKSITQRALLLSALAVGSSQLKNLLLSTDTLTLIKALRNCGVSIFLDKKKRTAHVQGPVFIKGPLKIGCASAGTVARFMIAFCAAQKGEFFFAGTKRLNVRPIKPLLDVLTLQEINVFPTHVTPLPVMIKSKNGLKGGKIVIDAKESSQFASALLMVAPLTRKTTHLIVKNPVSKPYITMTIKMMQEFGVTVKEIASQEFIILKQPYLSQSYAIEPDASTASYFFAAAAITKGTITIKDIHQSSKQGDMEFLTILNKMGCKIFSIEQGITLQGPENLQGISVDMQDCSDTFMTLAAIAPFAKTPTLITNIFHTRLQESDRLMGMFTELKKLNIKVQRGEDWLKIYPSKPVAGVINPNKDHRIAMAFALIGLRTGGIEIIDAASVNKSCPDFFTILKKLY